MLGRKPPSHTTSITPAPPPPPARPSVSRLIPAHSSFAAVRRAPSLSLRLSPSPLVALSLLPPPPRGASVARSQTGCQDSMAQPFGPNSSKFRRRRRRSILLTIGSIVVFSTVLWKRQRGTTTHRTRSGMQPPEKIEMNAINYVEVPSGRGDVKRYAATQRSSGDPISIRSWMASVSSDSPEGAKAASDLTDIISSSSYASVLFETPGACWNSSGEDRFEFALVNEPALRRFAENNPDRYSFAEHFDACRKKERRAWFAPRKKSEEDVVCSFANLGGDALLVAPLPTKNADDSHYSHLAIFSREAPRGQVAAFWRLGARRYLERLRRNHERDPNVRTWFSTNGMGVSWLHLRLDGRPKYYSYGPFKRPSTADLPRTIVFDS